MRGRADLFAGLILGFFFMVFPRTGQATLEETLPAYHWSYSLIDQLRLRGYFTTLFISSRPYTRGDVARSLRKTREDIDAGKRHPTTREAWMLDQLNAEFEDERVELADTTAFRVKLGITGSLDGLYRDSDLEHPDIIHYGALNTGGRAREGLRSKISAGFNNHLTLYHTLRFDRHFTDDPTYTGRAFRGMAGFTEQAYVQLRYGPARFKIGRDYLYPGTGKSGHLLLSDNSRTFDMYSLALDASFMRFSAFGIQLDDVALDSVVVRGQGPVNTARRYINGHRLDIRLGSWLEAGVSELVIYGGPRRNFELAYVNPVNFYHDVTLNDGENQGRPANTLGSLDVSVYPATGMALFGEWLIDDIKIEKVNLSDLEPDRLGFILGGRYASPPGMDGVTLHAEYARVSNRTYNVLFNPWERFLHRGRPIGYFLGNNFDRFEIGGSAWPARSLFVAFGYEHLRQGQDNITAPYNTDYLNVPSVDQGYSEPFPFGSVQRTHAFTLSAQFIPSIDLRLNMDVRLARVRNSRFTGSDRSQIQLFRVGVLFNYERIWKWN